MREAFILLVLLTWGSAAAALCLRNLVRSALLFTASWAGIAGFYLWAGSEFAAFAQGLVYVGAVSMIALFAVLLTRPSPAEETPAAAARPGRGAALLRAACGIGAALAVAACLGYAILSTPLVPAAGQALGRNPAGAPVLTVRDLGRSLMIDHPIALLAVGVILTVALLGAVTIAAPEGRSREDAP